ncbi:GntR family transcriptional regulator [Micromonospora sp. CPCC 206061]|uniref:GntR family transcriptional regulator n=1 Tax=Micromonospora sp. CPCC 206061 TaxID=3122410 RepID=UPI002FEF4160
MARKLRSTQVYDALRKEIIEGTLPPGSRLAARALAERFESSDIPVREAIWMLARDGLVENIPYAGARVRTFTQREIEETYAIRGYLESLAINLGAGRLDPAQVAAVHDLMGQLDTALAAGDLVAYGRLNRPLHEALLLGCPNSRLLQLLEQLWDGQASYQMVFRLNPARARASQEEHRRIVEAVINGDGERAAALILEHRQHGARALSHTPLTETENAEELAH